MMKSSGLVSKLLILVVVAAAVGLAIKYGAFKTSGTVATDSKAFYAVFLTNDQVYFGHLSEVNDQYVGLKNIYYLKLSESLQQSSDAAAANDKSQINLVKLGSELHGPKDEMRINRDQILFFEELKDDSKVVKSIQNGEAIGQ